MYIVMACIMAMTDDIRTQRVNKEIISPRQKSSFNASSSAPVCMYIVMACIVNEHHN